MLEPKDVNNIFASMNVARNGIAKKITQTTRGLEQIKQAGLLLNTDNGEKKS